MSLRKLIFNSITSKDLFGDPITFNLRKKMTPQTLIGGILTISLIMAMMILFLLKVNNTIKRVNPTISSYLNFENQVDPMNLSKSNMPIAFTMTDDDGNEWGKLINLKVYLQYWYLNNGKWLSSSTIVPTEFCTPNHFPEMDPDEFEKLNLNSYSCIKDQNITLTGIQNDSNNSTSLFIVTSYCDTDDLKCDFEAKREFFKSAKSEFIYFSMYFQNKVYEPLNFSKPINEYTNYIYYYLDLDKINYSFLYLSRKHLITDYGRFFTSLFNDTIISYEKLESKDIPSYYDRNKISYLEIVCSNIEYSWVRVYEKIPSIMADVGAIYGYAFYVIKLFCGSLSNSKKNLILMNDLLEFDVKEISNKKKMFLKNFESEISKNENKIGKTYDYLNETKNISKNFSKTMINLTNVQLQRYNNNVNENHNQKRHNPPTNVINQNDKNNNLNYNLEISEGEQNGNGNIIQKNDAIHNEKDFCNLRKEIAIKNRINLSKYEKLKLNYLCCCYKTNDYLKKYLLFKIGERKILEMSEISYVMKKLEDVEKLKSVVLNNEQLSIFNLLSKEICSLDSDKLKLIEYNKTKELQSDFYGMNKEIDRFLRKLKKKNKKPQKIYRRLINKLPIEIKEKMMKAISS